MRSNRKKILAFDRGLIMSSLSTKILSVAALCIFVSFLSCDGNLPGDLQDVHNGIYGIGSTGPGGGSVFYITDGGLHGLEAAASDQSTSSYWSSISSLVGTSTNIGTGASNTALMLALGSAAAAEACRDYRGGGFNDWFLPSKEELELMYLNLKLNGLGKFSTAYWSSSEDTPANAWFQYFTTGAQTSESKISTPGAIRAIRAF